MVRPLCSWEAGSLFRAETRASLPPPQPWHGAVPSKAPVSCDGFRIVALSSCFRITRCPAGLLGYLDAEHFQPFQKALAAPPP